jgi:hypothetical protein
MKNLAFIVLTLMFSLFAFVACDDGKDGSGDAGTSDVSDAGGEVSTDAADSEDSADATDADAAQDSDGKEIASPPDTTNACPTELPGPGSTCSTDGKLCSIGKECCCGQCYPGVACKCSGGTWACYNTDACLLAVCPDATADTTSDVPAVDATDDTGPADVPPADVTPDANPVDVAPGDTSSACTAATAALAATMYAKPQAFTVTVRLDHDSLALLGYSLAPGPYKSLDETAARAEATKTTGHGAGSLLSGPTPEDAWVFYESPGDFGGVGVVSARTGLSAFGGSIVWDGAGDITWPTAWAPASELASGCPASGGLGVSRGFDLVTGEALEAKDVSAALAVVADTALPGAMWQGGYAFDAVVLRYPRSVGVFNPGTAEWIVVLSGGWLE